jgi:hypothetical protein
MSNKTELEAELAELDAQYAVREDRMAMVDALSVQYADLIASLEDLERQHDVYLVEVNIDHDEALLCDNVDKKNWEECPEYWRWKIALACASAGYRAEEQGFKNEYVRGLY